MFNVTPIVITVYGLSQLMPLANGAPHITGPENGIWVSTCLGGRLFLNFGSPVDPEPITPDKTTACHVTCREEKIDVQKPE